MKKIYKSNQNKICFGVIGGLGEYLNVDPVILRLAWVLIAVFTGILPGIVVYLAAALIIPEKPAVENIEREKANNSK